MRSSAAAPSVLGTAVPGGDDARTSCVDRRCLLVAATAGAAAVLTGCSALQNQQSTALTPMATDAAVGTATPAATGSASGAGAADPGMGSAAGMPSADAMATTTAPRTTTHAVGHPIVKLAEIPVGGGAVIAAARLVVTRPTATTVRAFSAICTHQGCTVNEVADGTINCPCHGARFDITDGSVTAGPAPSGLPAIKVAVHAGTVVKV